MREIPIKAARRLIDHGFTSEKYQEVQDQRIKRMEKWQELNLEVLISNELELINYGKAVLLIMKGYEKILQN